MSKQNDKEQKYILGTILGEGGEGTVYLGTDMRYATLYEKHGVILAKILQLQLNSAKVSRR